MGDIDDALQEVFVVAYRRLGSLEEPERVAGWLRGVAVNVARNRRRGKRRSPIVKGIEVPEPTDGRGPEVIAMERQTRTRLLQLLDALPDEQRDALVLFEIEGVSMKAIAQTLGLSLATVYRRLEEARNALRRGLDQGEPT